MPKTQNRKKKKLFSALLLCFCFRLNRSRRNNCKVHIFSLQHEKRVHAQHRHFVKSEKLCSFMLYLIRHTAASFFFTTIGEHLNRKLSRDTKKKKKEKEEETARFYYFIFLSKSRTPAKNMLYCFVKTY